nr:RNA-directed DNA polymerase (reverse transcriptase) and Integrase domain containing protein [Haemonchus contortus]
MTQLTYLGNVITAAGRRPDPKKIDAITQMPKPKDTAQVRSFLGLINYYGAFVPEMRQIRAPLDALLKKDTPFNWNPECDAAFERAKEVEVDDDSKELLTINTHRGLYRYNRLPFGVKSAPGIFQQIIDSMISGLNGVAAYLDDVIVTGRTLSEHNANLEALFSRISAYGFRVRADKCHFVMTQLTYLGNVITAAGRRPDPKKIDAITQMPKPKDTAQVRSFLGLINYYGAFVPEMRQIRAPLDALLKKDTPFNWNPECDAAFERAKEVLASDLLLTHYNPDLPIVVAADASDYGIGAVISHRFPDGSEKAVYHASRSLSATEKNYGQIEKEGLALIYAVRKFHRYIYGRHFTLLTDHKPLLAIFGSKKGVPAYSANRLQRWRLTLRAYDFDIEYRSTTSFGQADALSRLIFAQSPPEEDVIIATIARDVNAIFRDNVNRLPVTAEDVARATAEDDCLRQVLDHVVHNNWPKKLPPTVANYAHLRNDLSTQQGCLLFGSRIIIPLVLQPTVMRALHEGHPGMNRMKALARSYVFWTKINDDLERLVRTCAACQESAKSPIKNLLCSWSRPDAPWSRIHIDFAGPIEGISYLVVVDAFSKWPEIIPMTSTTSTATLRELRRLFAQFGLPQTIVSDNGTQFTSADFQDFCRINGIKHVRSPPFHPQSNGQAERFVDTFKRSIGKIRSKGPAVDALHTFLFTYRNTPCTSSPDGRSPAENFIGRRLRSTLDLLKPSHSPEARSDIVMEMQFNRRHGAKPKTFEPKDLVFARDFRSGQPRWSPGHVLRRRGRTLYDVLVQGSIWKRHANQLRPRDSLGETIDLTNAFDMPFNSSPDSPSGTSSTLPLSPMATTAPLTTTTTTTTTTTAPPAPPAMASRRSARTRRPPDFLQIDPTPSRTRVVNLRGKVLGHL